MKNIYAVQVDSICPHVLLTWSVCLLYLYTGQHKVGVEKQELAVKFCEGIIHLNNDQSFEASYLGTSQSMIDSLI